MASTRCKCGKYPYESKKKAEEALKEIHRNRDDQYGNKYSPGYSRSENRVYECQYKNWHVTGSPPP